MSEWTAKKFWTAVRVDQTSDGFRVLLDDRPLHTPAKAALTLPTGALAGAIAEEWRAQSDKIDPATMPLTRTANSAIDKVTPQRGHVIDMLAAYGATDLLCYRATGPGALQDRQRAEWDPLLDWAANRFGAPLSITEGVMPVAQAPASLEALKEALAPMSDFAVAAVHDLISLSGSLVLALAVSDRHIAADRAWNTSRLDETWQAEQWGADEEADAMAAIKRTAFFDAARFFDLANRRD